MNSVSRSTQDSSEARLQQPLPPQLIGERCRALLQDVNVVVGRALPYSLSTGFPEDLDVGIEMLFLELSGAFSADLHQTFHSLTLDGVRYLIGQLGRCGAWAC